MESFVKKNNTQAKFEMIVSYKRLFGFLPKINSVHYMRRRLVATSPDSHEEYYTILELKPGCSQEELRKNFLNLAKKYHPDSNHLCSSTDRFHQIENAYRKLQEKFSKLNEKKIKDNIEETEYEDEFEHTVPQHRQFLTNEGIGFGTPFQREKQYQKHRATKAIESVYKHRLSKLNNPEEYSLVTKDTKSAKKIQTKYGIERLVEDLILESMAKGEFQNLKGTGKPLNDVNNNPYVDMVTHKINQVLIDNGFSPQWVTLEKEIREEISFLKEKLQKKFLSLGKYPFTSHKQNLWKSFQDHVQSDVIQINKKIDNYNLVVPLLHKQMVHVNLSRLSVKILNEKTEDVTANASLK